MLRLEPPIPLLLLRSRRLSFVAAGVGSRGPALTCHGPAWAFVGLWGLVWESLVSVNEIHKKENHLLTRC